MSKKVGRGRPPKPAESDPVSQFFMKKRDKKAFEKEQKKVPAITQNNTAPPKYVKKDKSSLVQRLFGKNDSAKAKPANIFAGGNPFAQKKSKFTKTLIATPSKFEIKVDKKKPSAVSLASSRSSRSAVSKKPEVKSTKLAKLEKKP